MRKRFKSRDYGVLCMKKRKRGECMKMGKLGNLGRNMGGGEGEPYERTKGPEWVLQSKVGMGCGFRSKMPGQLSHIHIY